MDGDSGGLLERDRPEAVSAAGGALTALVLCFAAAMAALVAVQNVQDALEAGPAEALKALLALAVIWACLWGMARRRWSARAVLAAALGLGFALRLGYVLAIDTPAVSDFGLLYQAAAGMAGLEGFSTPWVQPAEGYFYWWGYQLPFVALQAAVLRLIPSMWALKLLNVAFMTGIHLLVYLLARVFASPRAAALAALLYAVYPGGLQLAPVLTNQHSAAFFLLLGVWLLLTRREWPWLLLAGLCLSVGNLLRPEGAVFLLTLLFCAGLTLARLPRWREALRLALGAAAVLLAFFAVSQLVQGAFVLSGTAPYGIGNRRPEWKFVVGLDFSGQSGSYSDENVYILYMEDDDARREEALSVVRESFRSCGDVPGFFLQKSMTMWGEGEPFFWSLGHLEPGPELEAFTGGMWAAGKALTLLVWLALPLAALALWQDPGRRGWGGAAFCLVAVCAAFCVYLLIETQSRYRYFVMPLLFALFALPLDKLCAREGR